MGESAIARANRLAYETEQRRYNFVRIWQKRYAHMVARHEGRSTNRSNSNGKGICTKEEFFVWCKDFNNLQDFLTIYFEWAQHGFPLHLAPSIDRVHSDKGYTCDNLQWLPFDENCRKHNINPIDHSQGGW